MRVSRGYIKLYFTFTYLGKLMWYLHKLGFFECHQLLRHIISLQRSLIDMQVDKGIWEVTSYNSGLLFTHSIIVAPSGRFLRFIETWRFFAFVLPWVLSNSVVEHGLTLMYCCAFYARKALESPGINQLSTDIGMGEQSLDDGCPDLFICKLLSKRFNRGSLKLKWWYLKQL